MAIEVQASDAVATRRRGKNQPARWSLRLALVSGFFLFFGSGGCGPVIPFFAGWTAGSGLAALLLGIWAVVLYLQSEGNLGGLIRAIFGIFFGSLGAVVGFSVAQDTRPLHRSVVIKGMSNCRQIQLALNAYASDHEGKYPDAAVAHPGHTNELFRKLFVEGYLSDERIFGCPLSSSQPDGKIGRAPDFQDAVQPGENHWAMTKGLTTESPREMPLVFESPAVASWPPKWNADAVETSQPGRVWKGAKVIIGFNDGSVNVMPLEADKGAAVGLAPKADGSPVFPDVHPTPEILDMEKALR